LIAAPHAAFEQHAVFDLEAALEHPGKRCVRVLQGDVGDEAQAPVVDADQRHAIRREMAAGAQHGAVAAHDHGQRGGLADFLERGDGIFGQPGIARRVRVDQHMPARLRQRVRKGSQRCVQAGVLVSADQGDGGKVHGCVQMKKGKTVKLNVPRMGQLADYMGPYIGLRDKNRPNRKRFPKIAAMDDRARALLKALIERYIADGQPVGSRTLSKVFDLSPATIRNVMADLEELGLIHSPHTSAGRVPTPRGYRMFVDSLLSVQSYQLQPHNMGEMLSVAEPTRAVNAAAALLSNLTQFAGVVLTPKRAQVFRQIEFIRLSDKRVLLIIVTPDGDVQNRILFVQRDYAESELLEAGNFFNMHFAGKSFNAVRQTLSTELAQLREDISRLMQAAVEASAEAAEDGDAVVISGERKLLEVTDIASDMDRLRKMFSLFEKKTDLLQLLDVSSRAQGVQIYIGGDSQLVPLEDVSVITAPYGVDGKVVGTLGVIGPTRMAYERVIPIVDITARLLSNALSHNQ